MKRDKGKSRRRIKDWVKRYESGRDEEGAAPSRESLSRREVKLGDGSFAVRSGDAETGNTVAGMVTGVFRHAAVVRTAEKSIKCGIAKTYRPPEGYENTTPLAVGDSVTVVLPDDRHTDGRLELDRNREEGMIVSRRLRKTLLARPETRRGRRTDEFSEPFVKVIAANMDCLLVVASLVKPRVRRGLIDRFTIAAERGELELILALNKTDLVDENDESRTIADDVGQRGTVVFCSARTGRGVAELGGVLAGKKSVLAGASGVGKTTLVNALVPDAAAATRPVREKDDRGRHTTSQARVYELPGGGLVIDTPGIRELGVGIDRGELRWYYPEFDAFAPRCRFNDCTHSHEPACAVVAAVEAGAIPARRYESYLRILETIER